MNSNIPSESNTENMPGTAAWRRSREIIDAVLWPSTRTVLMDEDRRAPMCVMDIAGMTGSTMVPFLDRLGPGATVLAFERDAPSSESPFPPESDVRVQRIHTSFENWQGEGQAQLIIGRCILQPRHRLEAILQKAETLLAEDGKLVLEIPDFAKSQGYPRTYALDRYSEYMQQYQESLGQPLTPNDVKVLCMNLSLRHPGVSMDMPHFLKEEHHLLPSLMLESTATAMAEKDFESAAELQAIISELRRMAGQPGVMITAPGVLRLIAYK